jgi:mycofactocin precursor
VSAVRLDTVADPTEVAEAVEAEPEEVDHGADQSDDELGELLIREITIDGMCGVY